MKTICPNCGHEQDQDTATTSIPPIWRQRPPLYGCAKCRLWTPCDEWLTREQVEHSKKSFEQLHAEAMQLVRQEWEGNAELHKDGVQPSQISALVGVLVKKGLLP